MGKPIDEVLDEEGNLPPGVYVGGRGVVPGMHHESIVVIPRDEKKLSDDAREYVKPIGPKGERGFIVSAKVNRSLRHYIPGPEFARGEMIGGTNISESDLETLAKGYRQKEFRRLKSRNVEKYGSRIHEAGQKHGDAKIYPSFFRNKDSDGPNSNSYVRSVLDDSGIKSEYDPRAPGSNFRFERLLGKLTEFEDRHLTRNVQGKFYKVPEPTPPTLKEVDREDAKDKVKRGLGVAAGGAVAAAGAFTLPAALPMLRIAKRHYGSRALHRIADRAADSKVGAIRRSSDSIRKKAKEVEGHSADFVSDYAESAKRLGDIPGAGHLGRNMAKIEDKVLRAVGQRKGPRRGIDDLHDSHYRRFMSGSSREGMKHWGYERDLEMLENEKKALRAKAEKLKSKGEKVDFDPENPPWPPDSRVRRKFLKGQDEVQKPGGHLDKNLWKGDHESKAIRDLKHVDDDDVQFYLKNLRAQNGEVATKYAALASISPAMMASGGALAIGSAAAGKKKDERRKERAIEHQVKTTGRSFSASEPLTELNAKLDQFFFSEKHAANKHPVKKDPSHINQFRPDPYVAVDPEKMNKQEATMSSLNKLGPWARGAVAGATAGSVYGGLKGKSKWKGALIGGAIGAPIQKGFSHVAEKEGDSRRPLNAMLSYSALPVAALGLTFVKKK